MKLSTLFSAYRQTEARLQVISQPGIPLFRLYRKEQRLERAIMRRLRSVEERAERTAANSPYNRNVGVNWDKFPSLRNGDE
jgi:hypothetical protein